LGFGKVTESTSGNFKSVTEQEFLPPFYVPMVKMQYSTAGTGDEKISAAFSMGIGSAATTIANTTLRGAFQAIAHGIIGGVMSMGQGGSFASGAASGAVSSIIGSLTAGYGAGAQILAGGLSGGIASSIAGGNFWDGVRQGLITAGLNHALHGLEPTQLPDGRYIWELSDYEIMLFANPETRYLITDCWNCDFDLTFAESMYVLGKMGGFTMPTASFAVTSVSHSVTAAVEEINWFGSRGGYGFFGEKGLKIANYKVDMMYANPSAGSGAGTLLSVKQMKNGGALWRWDYGEIHKTGSTAFHSTIRYYWGGTKYGSTAQRTWYPSSFQAPFFNTLKK
jgi:hypothetical protein